MLSAGGLQCLILKKAEDKDGFIARLWNHSKEAQPITLAVNGKEITEYEICDVVERKIEGADKMVAPERVVTVRFW